MKRIAGIVVILVLSCINFAFSQKVDTIIHKEAYDSYYSYTVKNPLYVVYHLYKGGGDCSRQAFRFISDSATADGDDYKKHGYDKGHLANAEDFAYDCNKEKSTFSYYNCLPQTPKLNRGIWKTWETKIRNESQQQHLKIVCGGFFNSTHTIGNGVQVPTYCWKIVLNEETGTLIHCLLFPNDDSDTFKETSLEELKKTINYILHY